MVQNLIVEEDLKLLGVGESDLLDISLDSVDSSLWKGRKTAVSINSIGTKNLRDATRDSRAKFVYISTDFVFSGKDDLYGEESTPSPVDWYGMSKFLGEKAVDLSKDLITRISFPYGYASQIKKDFVWRLYDLISSREEVSLIADQIITPTFIDDVVLGIDFLLEQDVKGIINLTGSSSHSPKEIGEEIKSAFGLTTIIGDSKLADVYSGKAERPFQSVMKNAKLTSLGFRPKTFTEGLGLIKTNT